MSKAVIICCVTIFLLLFAIMLGGSVNKFDLVIKEGDAVLLEKSYGMPFGTKAKVKLFYGGDEVAFIRSLGEPNVALQDINKTVCDDLKALVASSITPPQNAKVASFIDGKFTYKEGKNGSHIDGESLAESIVMGFDFDGIQVTVTRKSIAPTIGVQALKEVTKRRGSFCTEYAKSGEGRKHNIKTAVERLNNTKVASGEVFSYNKCIGSRNGDNGYLNAKIIENGKYVEGMGGGVCQVSTTLYNATLLSGLCVKEVHRYSLPVCYVPLSQDAMVSDFAYFKFCNNTPFPVYIRASCDGNFVSVNIYGSDNLNGLRPKLVSEKIGETEYGGYVDLEGREYDCLPQGKTPITAPSVGVISRAYLELYKGDVLVTKKLVRSDAYKPMRGLCS